MSGEATKTKLTKNSLQVPSKFVSIPVRRGFFLNVLKRKGWGKTEKENRRRTRGAGAGETVCWRGMREPKHDNSEQQKQSKGGEGG
jgi:hypothetical protein